MVDLVRKAAVERNIRALVRPMVLRALLGGGVGGAVASSAIWLASQHALSTILALLLGALVGCLVTILLIGRNELVRPVRRVLSSMPQRMFGFCSGLTRPDREDPAITDWLHRALQHIAFGSPGWPEILTFGHLEKISPKASPIELRMVTTNLSMMRPHTLPNFGMQAGFDVSEWNQLFPASVISHLVSASRPWKGMRLFPQGENLPVVVAPG